jgi:hypothetical protein
MTDEARHYKEPGRDFASHEAVNHSKDEYVRYWNEVTDKTGAKWQAHCRNHNHHDQPSAA